MKPWQYLFGSHGFAPKVFLLVLEYSPVLNGENRHFGLMLQCLFFYFAGEVDKKEA